METERCWEILSGPELSCLSLQLALVTMEIRWVFQIPAGRGKGYNFVPLPHKTPFIKTLEAVFNGFIND